MWMVHASVSLVTMEICVICLALRDFMVQAVPMVAIVRMEGNATELLVGASAQEVTLVQIVQCYVEIISLVKIALKAATVRTVPRVIASMVLVPAVTDGVALTATWNVSGDFTAETVPSTASVKTKDSVTIYMVHALVNRVGKDLPVLCHVLMGPMVKTVPGTVPAPMGVSVTR